MGPMKYLVILLLLIFLCRQDAASMKISSHMLLVPLIAALPELFLGGQTDAE